MFDSSSYVAFSEDCPGCSDRYFNLQMTARMDGENERMKGGFEDLDGGSAMRDFCQIKGFQIMRWKI